MAQHNRGSRRYNAQQLPFIAFHSLLGGFVDEGLVNVRDDTTTSYGALDEGVQLLISTDCKLQVARGDTLHLEILAGIASQLKNLSSKVLKDCCRVHSSSGTHTAISRDPLLELPVYTTHRELRSANTSRS